MITKEKLKLHIHYNPETGVFTRLIRIRKRLIPGCGGISGRGYVQISICGRKHLAHRLAWLYVFGSFPRGCIDHINGNKTDNRICNLREVDHATNSENQRHAMNTNSIGLLGVHKNKNKFVSSIQIRGKKIMLGYFDTAKEAHECYIKNKRVLHIGCTL